MTMTEMNSVTLREYSVGGTFQYSIDLLVVQTDCLAVIGEPVKNDYY
jgi:hypothetical protein